MTLDCKNSSGWDKKNKTEKSNNNLFLCSCCRRLWFPKQLNYSSDVPAFGIFLFLLKSPHHTLWHIGYMKKERKTILWLLLNQGKNYNPLCCQAGRKLKASPRFAYVKNDMGHFGQHLLVISTQAAARRRLPCQLALFPVHPSHTSLKKGEGGGNSPGKFRLANIIPLESSMVF